VIRELFCWARSGILAGSPSLVRGANYTTGGSFIRFGLLLSLSLKFWSALVRFFCVNSVAGYYNIYRCYQCSCREKFATLLSDLPYICWINSIYLSFYLLGRLFKIHLHIGLCNQSCHWFLTSALEDRDKFMYTLLCAHQMDCLSRTTP
jgi:hypothetical protein